MKMYFAIDDKKKRIVNDFGDEFTAEQFKKIIQRNAAKNKFFDMTLMTQRFITLDYNFEALNDFYKTV
jgi:hypothetical protein